MKGTSGEVLEVREGTEMEDVVKGNTSGNL